MLSIIVPVYNTREYLDECIQSIVSQDYTNWELILIDDYSTDGSGDLLDQWEKKDSRIRVIHKTGNSGVSDSRNIALKMAKGDYIGFVDSDDWIEPEMYSKMCELLEKTDADAVFGGYNRIEESGTVRIHTKEPNGKMFSVDDALLQIMPQRGAGRYNMFLWDKLFRRSVLSKEGELILFDSNYLYGEDVLWLTEVLLNCTNITFCQECGYNYRATRSNNTWSAMNNYRSIEYCLSAMETNQRILQLLQKAESKAENNQLQRVLYYQRYTFRTAAKHKNQKLYRIYRKDYYPSLFKWYMGNKTRTGLKWLFRQIVDDLWFQICRLTNRW